MAKKRANGEGSIRKRKDGRWEGRYTAGHDPETGNAIYKNVLGRSQAEVKEKLKQAIGEAQALDVPRSINIYYLLGVLPVRRKGNSMAYSYWYQKIYG